jgi:hypothetical protein
MEAGVQKMVQYNCTAGTPLTIMTQSTNMVFNANTDLQLKYTEQSQLAIKYMGVDVEAGGPLTLQVYADATPNATKGAYDGLGEYFRFESNETAAQLTLRAFIDAQEYAVALGRPVSQDRLAWAYWNGEDWVPAQSWVDEQGSLVCEGGVGEWTIREMREVNLPEGVSMIGSQVRSQVRALNYTEIDPQGFKYSLDEGEPTLFMFQNTAMVFNSTKGLRLNLSAENTLRNGALGISLMAGAPMELNVSMTSAPTGGASEARGVGIYMNLEHNATTAMKASLAMPVDVEALEAKYGSTFDPNQLKWAWWNGEKWMEVPSTLTADGVLVAETDHFSTWTIVESETSTDASTPTPTTPTVDYTWYIVGGAVVVAAVVLVFFLRGKK